MRLIRAASGLALAAALAAGGCAARSPASTALAGSSPEAWERALGARHLEAGAVQNPIEWTAEMRETALALAGGGSIRQRLAALQDGLFDPARFPFRYESRGTFTAKEAFAGRRGNCLSFTCLFLALARSTGLDARAAIPAFEGRSEREGDLVVVNTHVVAAYSLSDSLAIFDFDLTRERRVVGARVIDDLHLAALYLNNIGVDDLRAARYEAAVARFENAIRLAPSLLAAKGNLGVARRRLGDVEGALRAYQEALAIDPHDPGILGNLAALYRMQGAEREARAALALADVSAASPFFLVVRGDLDRTRGRCGNALRLYRRAHRMQRDLADPLVGIAEAQLCRGQGRAALSAARKALAIDPSNADIVALVAKAERAAGRTP
jgi:tetratricopeptide (TPR) repeat protein